MRRVKRETDPAPETVSRACPLCHRTVPKTFLTDHHLKTRRPDKHLTERICVDCHRTIHGLFDNDQIRQDLNTLEAIAAHPRFAAAVGFIRKQRPGAARPTKKRKWFRRG